MCEKNIRDAINTPAGSELSCGAFVAHPQPPIRISGGGSPAFYGTAVAVVNYENRLAQERWRPTMSVVSRRVRDK